MSLSIDLTDKKAVITGVSSGIGAGIAQALALAGCHVAGCGLDATDSPGAKSFLQTVENYERRARYTQLDVCDEERLSTWVQESADFLGGIDIVVSNAGRSIFAGALNCSAAAWNEALNLNLASHWKLARAAHAHLLKAKEPVIIIISSNHAFATIPGCFPYNVAKAGLVALVQSLTIEWGPKIRTVGIAPGFIDTPGNDTWFASFPDPSAERARTEKRHPVGRIGTADEIGGLCAFLASTYGRFIAGTTILVDGGRSALMQDS